MKSGFLGELSFMGKITKKSTLKREEYIKLFGDDPFSEEHMKIIKNTYGYEKARLGDAVIDFKRTVKEVFINDITKIKNFFRRKNK